MRALCVVLGVLLLSTSFAAAKPKTKRKRIAASEQVERKEVVKVAKPKSRGQSFGAAWSGSLKNATKFKAPERVHIRRPHRIYGTRTTIEHTRRAIIDTLESFPKAHTLAIGDFSAKSGGWITE